MDIPDCIWANFISRFKIVKITDFESVTFNFLYLKIMGYYRPEYRVVEF